MATPGKTQLHRTHGLLSVKQDLSQSKLIDLFSLCLIKVQN